MYRLVAKPSIRASTHHSHSRLFRPVGQRCARRRALIHPDTVKSGGHRRNYMYPKNKNEPRGSANPCNSDADCVREKLYVLWVNRLCGSTYYVLCGWTALQQRIWNAPICRHLAPTTHTVARLESDEEREQIICCPNFRALCNPHSSISYPTRTLDALPSAAAIPCAVRTCQKRRSCEECVTATRAS